MMLGSAHCIASREREEPVKRMNEMDKYVKTFRSCFHIPLVGVSRNKRWELCNFQVLSGISKRQTVDKFVQVEWDIFSGDGEGYFSSFVVRFWDRTLLSFFIFRTALSTGCCSCSAVWNVLALKPECNTWHSQRHQNKIQNKKFDVMVMSWHSYTLRLSRW